jgi:hypothetical protein
MNVIKNISFKNTPYEYYDHPLLTADEEDRKLLDASLTNLQAFHNPKQYSGINWEDGTRMMEFPKFHRGEKYQLPVNEYSIIQYDSVNVKIHFGTVENYSCGEGKKVEIIGDAIGNYHLDKVYPLLNFEGRSWQHFCQDCLPILMFGLDFIKQNPDVDLLIYEPGSWSKETFLELMKYFNLDNRVVFIPYGAEIFLNIKTLYNFEAQPTVPVCWWNNWFYETANQYLNTSDKNTNVILVHRKNSRCIENFEEISNILKKYSKSNKLNYLVIDPSEYNASDLFEMFNNAHTVLSPNGGANFHMLFCNKNTKFIEIGFTDWSYILYNIASSIKFKYYVIPIKGHNHTLKFHISPEKIKTILNN